MKLTFAALVLSFLVNTSFASEPFSREESLENTVEAKDTNFPHRLLQMRLIIPHGNSVIEQVFKGPKGGSPLRITYLNEATCPVSPGLIVHVRIASTGLWEETTVSNMLDYYSGAPIDAMRFNFTQSTYQQMTCTWNVDSNVGDTVIPSPSNKEVLVGAISYTGGFILDAKLALATKPFVTEIRLAVPSFCSDVEVLGVATETEGILDKATPKEITKNTFIVNEGSGSRISGLQVTMNGPKTQSCDIPVYLTLKQD